MRSLALLLLVGCGGRTQLSPAEHEGPCDPEDVHVWRVLDAVDGLYTFRVDTLAADATFDPDLFVYRTDSWPDEGVDVNRIIEYSDDDLPCSFPPAEGFCPQMLTRIEGLQGDPAILVGALSCDASTVRYLLTVERDSAPVEVEYRGVTPVAPFIE